MNHNRSTAFERSVEPRWAKQPTKIISFMSVFETTAYLKYAKVQYVSSGFRCRVITGSLMSLY